MKHILKLPANTKVEFKSHDSSIAQRTALDEQRREKAKEEKREQREQREQQRERPQLGLS